MKLSTPLLLLCPFVVIASVAVAQTDKPQTDKPAYRPGDTRPATPQTGAATKEIPFTHKASEVIGAKIKNSQGEDLGKIDDLVIDPSNGRIGYAILSFGGILGMGDKLVALPFELVKTPAPFDESKKGVVVLDIDKAKLEKAPNFTKATWPDVTTPAWSADIDKYYGISRVSDAKKMADALGAMRASELLGEKVESPANEDLGKIKELVLDPARGRINYFVMTSGGVLGMGDKLYAIPWEALKCNKQGNDEKCSLAISKDRLERAPEYKSDDWKAMSDPTWIGEMYVFYGYEPYWRTGAAEAGYRSGGERP